MTPDRWEQIKNTVKKQFPEALIGSEELFSESAEGKIAQGTAEYLVFESPIGKTKLQLQKKPKLESKKYHYSHRQGDAARVEYKFSETDLVYFLKAYLWDEMSDDWREIDANKFANF